MSALISTLAECLDPPVYVSMTNTYSLPVVTFVGRSEVFKHLRYITWICNV